MATSKTRKVWRVEGYDGDRLIFESTIPLGGASVGAMRVLMQRLACRHLSGSEIVSASLRRNAKGRSNLLDLADGPDHRVICSGQNPHYVASVVEQP